MISRSYDTAFQYYLLANDFRRKDLDSHFTIELYEKEIEALISNFTESSYKKRHKGSSSSRQPVFVVGMPRSGTTLLEQIIASHSLGFGAGELPTIKEIVTDWRGIIQQKPFTYTIDELSQEQIEHRSQEMLNLFELTEAADDPIDTYSHGMQQKTALASALLHDPQVLVMDEPTVGLDPRSARLIKDILRQLAERGAAIFLSTHILEIAERMCDRIGIIDNGKLIAVGTMQELRALGKGESSLEDIFLNLTGGTEYAEIAAVLK
jgi:ABC-type dipeptide/oligopeptide/nickel transport system ATPase component